MTPPIRRRISEVKETRFTLLPETTTTKYIYIYIKQCFSGYCIAGNEEPWPLRDKKEIRWDPHLRLHIWSWEGLPGRGNPAHSLPGFKRQRESLGRPRQREWIQQTTTEGRLSQRERQIRAGDLLKIEQGTNLHKCEDTVSQGKHLLERTKKNNAQSWPKTENRGGPGKPRKAGSLGVGSQEEGPLRSGE